MRVVWDPNKSKILKENPQRRTSFEEARHLIDNLETQLGSDLKSLDPEQYYVIGVVNGSKQ